MTKQSASQISIVIPLFNEELGLDAMIAELNESLSSIEESFEIILVDDGSKDGTWQGICRHCEVSACVRGIQLSRNFGKEAALSAGLDAALGDAVIVMDGDRQHPPTLIPQMLTAWRNGAAEVIEAVKFDRGNESFLSRARANIFYKLLKLLSGLNLEGMSDFKLLDRKVVDEWRKLHERNRFFRGMVAWLGFKHLKIPFSVPERLAGDSGWSVWGLVKLAIGAITSFSTMPLHFSTISGVVFALIAVVLGLQTLWNKFAGVADAGFTTVILLVLIVGSVMLLSVGVIGEYIARIYYEVKGRPPYVIRERLGMGLLEGSSRTEDPNHELPAK